MPDDLSARRRVRASRRHGDAAQSGTRTEPDGGALLLGQVAAAIARSEETRGVLAAVLEKVSIFWEIEYCAFLEARGAELVILQEHVSFAAGTATGAVLRAPQNWFEDLVDAGNGPRSWSLPAEAVTFGAGGFEPSSVELLSLALGDGPLLLLLVADGSRSAPELASLTPLLWQVLGMAWARIDKLRRLRHQATLAAGRERRTRERTAELDEANGRLQREVADRVLAQHGLRVASAAIENCSEGVVITDPLLRIQAVNRAVREITGYGAPELLGRHPGVLESGRDGEAFFDSMRAVLLACGRWRSEIWIRRKDGGLCQELLSLSAVRDDHGEVENYVGVFSDNSALKESEARLDFLSHHDLLTGLPNRLLFNARGEHALARVERGGSRVAVMCVGLDFDRFEHLDDTLGQPAGDELLRRVAERVAACVPIGDTVGRARGDEFTVLLEDLPDAGSAVAVARKILDALAAPFNVGGNELFIAASVGVSVSPEDGNDFATLMKQAAGAMHGAREQARGGLQFYTAELTRVAVERFHMENDLRQALRGNEFVLHYQPQVSVRTGRIVGVEALIRWLHPQLGLVLPSRFIPLAEEIGLAEGIGSWVLRTACLQARDWPAAGLPPLRVAVNLSAEELSAPSLTERIAAALEESGLDPRGLEIEITEGSLMANLESTVAALEAVRALGVTIALDDFGTGYSSLNYLRRLPIDRLKLDRSFIAQIARDGSAQAIARAAIELGHGLKAELVAEGVESAAQLDFLRANGCDAYQGHLFSAALPADRLAPLLSALAR